MRILAFAFSALFSLSAFAAGFDDLRVNIDGTRLWNTGVANDGIYSAAFRIGASTRDLIPMHSTIDFGVLENHRRKYIRFNAFGVGYQPELITSRTSFSGFARVDLVCGTLAETGYFAYTPGGELGFVLGVAGSWALTGGFRQSIDITDPRSSMTSVILGLMTSLGQD